MDTEWFTTRMETLGLRQEDIGAALGMDRSTVSRIQSGARPLTFAEVEPLAKIMQVSAIEIIERAHTWRTPIRTQIELRSDLLMIAISIAERVLACEPVSSPQDRATLTQAIYEQMLASEAQGQPIDNDDRALRLIEDTLRRTRAATVSVAGLARANPTKVQ